MDREHPPLNADDVEGAKQREIDRELRLLLLGELVLTGDANRPPDDPDSGEFAELSPILQPPDIGSVALTGRFAPAVV